MILVAKDMLTIPNPLHMGIEGKTLVFPSMGVEKGVQFHLWKSCTLRTAYKAAHLITSSLMAVKSRPPLSVISSTSMRTNVVDNAAKKLGITRSAYVHIAISRMLDEGM